MSPMRAAPSAWSPTCSRTRARHLCRRHPRRIRQGARGARKERAHKRRITLEAAAQQPLQDRLVAPTRRPRPSFLGTRTFADYDLAELARYIDWTPFFQTWELSGRYPQILDRREVGEAAHEAVRRRPGDAEAHRRRAAGSRPMPSSASGPPTPSATTSSSTTRTRAATPIATLHTLRQQIARDPGRDRATPRSPISSRPRTAAVSDYVGGFAVTAGIGEEEALERHLKKHRRLRRIMVKALSDRFAEAFAERMHERVRRELWGYATDEKLTTRISSSKSTAASARRPAIPPSPTTPRRRRSSVCSMPRHRPASN